MSGKARAEPCVSSMSPAQPLCDSTESTESPISLALRLSNSGLAFENAPSSVVQTGVKSLGWEKRIPQLSPSHSWKLIVPSVVSAVKSGAVSPSRTAICSSWGRGRFSVRGVTLAGSGPIVDTFGHLLAGGRPGPRKGARPGTQPDDPVRGRRQPCENAPMSGDRPAASYVPYRADGLRVQHDGP